MLICGWDFVSPETAGLEAIGLEITEPKFVNSAISELGQKVLEPDFIVTWL
jgi:hypothetical protein